MASINASTSGAGGVITTADATGNLSLQSGGTTVVALTSAGAAVTGTLSATGAANLSNTLAVTGAITATGGIVQGANSAPAFSAYRATTNQSISNATTTKVQLNAEEFDTNSNFDSTTNYRFTPTVAGYYQMNGSVAFNTTTMNLCVLFIYKNGSAFKRGTYISATQSTDSVGVVSGLIYFNGTSDYAELYAYINATVGSPVLVAGLSDGTRLDGIFVRST